MSNPEISISDCGGATVYSCEFDLSTIANEYARRISKELDAEVLRVLEEQYGFVNPVRCRDCEHGQRAHYWGRTIIDCHGALVQTWDYWQDEPLVNEVEPDGFCAWGVRRADA